MFILPELPYELSALEPHISAHTLEFHHGKHHAGYTKKLNEALTPYPNLLELTIEELLRDLSQVPEEIQGAVRKNGAQYYNHLVYWLSMSPNGGGSATSELGAAITEQFGSYEAFVEKFSKAGATQFGSGWVWLSVDNEGKLSIDSTSNEDTPLMHGKAPLLTMDVWEHAYYLDYQNRRPDYTAHFFEIIDWKGANERYLDIIND